MAQPPAYVRQYSFTAFQANNPSLPLPADKVELEYNEIKETLDAILERLVLIQRDDGQVANDTIGNDQLREDVDLLTPRGEWASFTTYTFRDLVTYNGRAFISRTDLNLNNTPPDAEEDTSDWMWLPVAGSSLVTPGVTTDNAIAVWDGADGSALKDSNIIVGAGSLTVGDVSFTIGTPGYGVIADLGDESLNSFFITGHATDDGGPNLFLYHDKAVPAVEDDVYISFAFNNSLGARKEYAEIDVYIEDPTAGSEDGEMVLSVMVAGVRENVLALSDGVEIGEPTGGAPGLGSLNVSGDYFINGVSLSLWDSVLNYGADPTGVADSTSAFQDAFDAQPVSGKLGLCMPDGTYKITATVAAASKEINLVGSGIGRSIINSSATGNTFEFTPATRAQKIILRDFTMRANAAGGNRAISIVNANSPSQTAAEGATIEHVNISSIENGSFTTKYWDNGIYISGTASFTIRGCTITGQANVTAPSVSAIEIGGGAFDHTIDGNSILFWTKGINYSAHSEGGSIVNNLQIRVAYGIYNGYTVTPLIAPRVAHNHFNNTIANIYWPHATQGIIANNLFYVQEVSPDTPLYGVYFYQSNVNVISDNLFHMQLESAISIPGIYLDGANNNASSSFGNQITGNLLDTVTTQGGTNTAAFIHLTANTSWNHVTDNVKLVDEERDPNFALWISDNSTNATDQNFTRKENRQNAATNYLFGIGGSDMFTIGAAFSETAGYSSSDGPGAIHYISQYSASPAANDYPGQLAFAGNDSGANFTVYSSLYGKILDPTNGSEDGAAEIKALIAGVETLVAGFANGVVVGAPTGSYQGTGTVNATNLFVNGTNLTGLYQPLDSDLTSWAGVTRASGFDTFAATPTLANLASLLTNEAAGFATFLQTPTSANFAAFITDDVFLLSDIELQALSGLTSAADKLPYFTGSGTAALADLSSAMRTFMATPSSANFASLVSDDAFSLADAELGALAGLTSAADKLPYFTGSGTAALADLSSAMRTFMTTPSSANFASLVSDDAFSLADAELGAIAGLASAADRLPYFTGSGTASLATFTATGRSIVDDASVAEVGQTLFGADPNADRIIFWDDSAGSFTYLTPGDGLAITTTTIAVTIDANTETAIEAAIDTLANLTSIQGRTITLADAGADAFLIWDDSANAYQNSSKADAQAILGLQSSTTDNQLVRYDSTAGNQQGSPGVTLSDNADLTLYDATNAGNPEIRLGASDAEELHIQAVYDAAAQTLARVDFITDVASATADKGLFRFNVDGTDIVDIDDGGLNFAASKGISIAGTDILTDSAGTATLSNIDALDATTESTIEAAIDTLANLTSVQGRTVTLADAGFDVLFGWDDSGNAYKNFALADIGTEAAPAAGDYVLIYGAEGDLRKANWSSLPGAGGGISNVVEDTTPQLGGNLDCNGFRIEFDDNTGIFDDSGNEQLIFQKTASAVNNFEITNAATGNNPTLSVAGGDTDVAMSFGVQGAPGDAYIFDMGAGDGAGVQFQNNVGAGESGPNFQFYANNSAPATDDAIGYLIAYGNSSTGVRRNLASVGFNYIDPTNGSEDASVLFLTRVAGVQDQQQLAAGDGVIIGTTTVFPGNGNLRVTNIEIGHDTANTLTASGGVLSIEGSAMYKVGGTDVALADGGTGASLSDPNADRMMFWDDSAGAVDWLTAGNGLTITTTTIAVDSASDTVDGIIELADQTEMEAGTATDRAVTPGRQHFHPAEAKFWVYWTGNSTTILRSYNMTSIANTGTGDADGTIANDFSDANWAGFVCTNETGTDGWDADSIESCGFNARAAGTFGVLCGSMVDGTTAVGNTTNPDQWQVIGYGDL